MLDSLKLCKIKWDLGVHHHFKNYYNCKRKYTAEGKEGYNGKDEFS